MRFPSHDEFRGRVGQSFDVAFTAEQSAALQLAECGELQETDSGSSYSMRFVGNSDCPPVQGTFPFTTKDFGPVEIFVVPVRADQASVDFQVIVNQVKD
jgi:hypothetical protein